MSARSKVFGQKTSCINDVISECGNCDHIERVASQLEITGNPEYLLSLIYGMLALQQQVADYLCNPDYSYCERGAYLNFPCVQCKSLFDSTLCGCEDIQCNGVSYTFPNCDLNNFGESDCLQLGYASMDFNETPELQAIYEKIIDALLEFDGAANWLGIDYFAKAIFGDQAAVIMVKGGVYYVSIGRDMTDAEIQAADFIPFPVPLDAQVKLMELA